MAESRLTPEEYELHLESGEGEIKQLLHDTESVLELADDFPEVLERNQDVQGLAAELMARREQQRFLAQSAAPR